MSRTRAGVLVMAHGTPSETTAIEAFYTKIRRGNPPSPDQLAELTSRYEAIGGVSPLNQVTADQAAEIQNCLGADYLVVIGTKFAEPTIEGAVESLLLNGVQRAVAVVLAPHYSVLTTEDYLRRATTSAEENGIELACIYSWHMCNGLIDFHAKQLRQAVRDLTGYLVVFSAHSLPATSLESADPYGGQVRESATAIARRVGLSEGSWSTCWQSAGRTDQEWLGPDLREIVRSAAAAGTRNVVVCPIGFSADNLETLYDIDIEARKVADEVGVEMARTGLPNASRDVMASISGIISDTYNKIAQDADRT